MTHVTERVYLDKSQFRAFRIWNRLGALCDSCRSRLVSIVALVFAAHWILEMIAVVAIARLACQ